MTRALALSGGGAKGAFQVGALRALAARGVSFDLFTGVSVGALNAALAARGKLDDLEAFWKTATNDTVFRRDNSVLPWLVRLFSAEAADLVSAARRGYIYDSAPLRAALEAKAGDPPPRNLRVGFVNLESGLFHRGATAAAVLASASMPLYFPVVDVPGVGRACVDGGLRHVTPLSLAFDLLKKRPADPSDELWAIVCTPLKRLAPVPIDGRNALKTLTRTVDLITDQIFREDLLYAADINAALAAGGAGPFRSPKYRRVSLKVIAPQDDLGGTLSFDPRAAARAMELGAAAAARPLDGTELRSAIDPMDGEA